MKICCFILALFTSCLLHAQVTLEQCQSWAQDNYPLIQQYGLIQKTMEYSVSNAERSWIPQVSLSAQFSYQSAVTAFPDDMKDVFEKMGVNIKGLNHEQYKAAVNVNQKIWDGGQSGNERRTAEAKSAVQSAETDVNMYAIRDRVNQLFFGILLQDAQLEQNRILQTQLKSNVSLLQSYYNNGIAMLCDVEMMEAELLSAQQQLTKIEASRDAFVSMLMIMTGHEIPALILPEEEGVNVADINRPELEYLHQQNQQLNENARSVRSLANPQISGFAEGFYGNPGLNLFKSMFENKWTWNFMGGIKVQWNVSSFYTRKNDLNKIKLAQEMINVQRNVFLFNNRLEVSQQQHAINKMREMLAQDAKIIALRTSVRQAYEQKLKNGIIETNDLLKEITNENQARIAELTHRIELLQNIYNLKYTVNN